MTRTLLGVMAIVQFSAKYLQCKLFLGVFIFYFLFLLLLLSCDDKKSH